MVAAALAGIATLAGPAARANAADRPAASAGSAPASSAATWCADRCDEIVLDWSVTAAQVIKAAEGYADPMAASRALAMMHLAMHDAVNAVRPRYRSYALETRERVDADAAIAAASAAHDVLAALYGQPALLKAALDRSLFEAGTAPEIAAGVALGKRAAAAILVRRSNDGSAAKESFREGTRAGEYRYTPGFDFLAAPHWRSVQPFLLDSPRQFRSAPPPALGSAAYAAAFDEVKAVGRKDAQARRSADETSYAAFWYEFSDIGWNRIARVVSREQKQDLWQRARTFALLNAALADAYIAGWDSKMHYNLWRPITAIRLAETDGNAKTVADATFEPLLPTPPVQDYPSTHSSLGAAAAAVLASAFGRDAVAFKFTSTTALPHDPARAFKSFSEAARENADSRVKAGIHFRFATEAGLAQGERIGKLAAQRLEKSGTDHD